MLFGLSGFFSDLVAYSIPTKKFKNTAYNNILDVFVLKGAKPGENHLKISQLPASE